MKLTTKKAMDLLTAAGLDVKYTTFVKWVREGRIPATMNNTKEGYRIDQEAILLLIQELKEDQGDAVNPLMELERLRQENEELRHKLSVPTSFVKAENLKLAGRVSELEQMISEMKRDRTLYIEVQ